MNSDSNPSIKREDDVGASLLVQIKQPKPPQPNAGLLPQPQQHPNASQQVNGPVTAQQQANGQAEHVRQMMQMMQAPTRIKQEVVQRQQSQHKANEAKPNQRPPNQTRPTPIPPHTQSPNAASGVSSQQVQQMLMNLNSNVQQTQQARQNFSIQSLLAALQPTAAAPPPVQAPASHPAPVPSAVPSNLSVNASTPQEAILQRLGLLIQQPQAQTQPRSQVQKQATPQKQTKVHTNPRQQSEFANIKDSQNQQKKQHPPAADSPVYRMEQAPNDAQVGATNVVPSSGGSTGAGFPSDKNGAEAKGEPVLGLNASKAPGTIILPCRARGMPVDHNFRTAHFVIPSTIGHGEDLICSYNACRNAGIKFRYCAACRVPVAKRNFHQRHGHGIPTTRKEAKDAAAAAAQESLDARKDELKRISKSHSMAAGAAEASRSSSVAVIAGRSSSKHGKKLKPPTQTVEVRRHSGGKSSRYQATSDLKRSSVRSSNHKVTDPSGTSGSTLKEEGIPRDRQESWAKLLRNRPDTNDSDGMSAWLLQVMAVSDCKTPLRQRTSSFTTTDESSSEISSYTDEAPSSLNSFTSSDGDFSSDVSSLGQEQKKSDAKKARIQKRRTHIPEPPAGSGLLAIPPMREVGGEGDEERKRRKKKQRTLETEEGLARKRKKHKVSSSKDIGNAASSSKRHGYKEKKAEKKPFKAEGNYAEWKERKKQKALSKKKRSSSDGKSKSQH